MALRNSTQGDVKASLLLVPQRQKGLLWVCVSLLSELQSLGMQVIRKAQDSGAEGIVLRAIQRRQWDSTSGFQGWSRLPSGLHCVCRQIPSLVCHLFRVHVCKVLREWERVNSVPKDLVASTAVCQMKGICHMSQHSCRGIFFLSVNCRNKKNSLFFKKIVSGHCGRDNVCVKLKNKIGL